MTTGTELLGTVVVPLVTALDPDGRPEPELADGLLRHLHAAGVTRLMLLGSNGEGAAVAGPDAARYAAGIRRRWDELAGPSGTVLATAAGVSTADSVRRAEALAHAGATTLVAMAPLYFRHTAAELADHVGAVLELGLPTVVYDQPGYTGNAFTTTVYRRLLGRPNFVGVKVSGTGGVDDLLALRAGRPDLGLASGNDRGMATTLAGGLDGLVLGTAMLAPGASLALFDAVRAGDMAGAGALQDQLEALLAIHTIRPGTSGIAAMKCALDLLGLCPETATAPFRPFTPAERAEVRAVLDGSPLTSPR